MPPLPAAPNVLRLRLLGVHGTAKWVNVCHVKFAAGTPTAADLTTLAASINTAWGTNMKSLYGLGANLTQVDLQDLTTNTGAYGANTTGQSGSNASGTLNPANVACCVSFKTDLHYRGGHPRMYLAGSTNLNYTNPTVWAGSYTTAVQAGVTAFINAINALTSTSTGALTFCALSYYQHKVLRPTGVPLNILSTVVHSRPDSMRRRLGKEQY